MPLLRLTTDIVFKMLFVRNPEALRSMLSAVLAERVEALTILNAELPGSLSFESVDKLIVLDVRVELESGKRIIVEMQMRVTEELPSRLVFYAARDLAGELQRGEDYGSLTPTVLIAWLGERMFPGKIGHLHRVFELRERRSAELLSDQLAVHVLQLDDFRQLPVPETETAAEQAVRRWARFLSAETESELSQLTSEDHEMQGAVNTVKLLSQDPDAVRLAEERQASVRLYHHALALAERKGKVEGERELLLRQLAKRFGALDVAVQQRLAAAQPVQLELWSERVLSAQTLADVFEA